MQFNIFKKTGIIFLFASSIFGSGCSKFLDERDPSNLTPESFYTIPEHAEAAIAAVYAETRFVQRPAAIFSANFQMLEAVTGTATSETNENTNLNNLYSLVYDGFNLHVTQWWNGFDTGYRTG